MPKKGVRKVTSFAVVFAATVFLAEISVRMVDPLGAVYYFDADRYFSDMTTDSDFGYIHRPGSRSRLHGAEVKINGEGFRGPEFSIKKDEGTTRVLVLGDSVVFGWGAPEECLFASLLEKKVRAVPIDCEIVPAGVGSWNTRMEYEFLKKRGIYYDPDIVLLMAVENDVYPYRHARTAVPKEKLFPEEARESILSRLVNKVLESLAGFSYLAASVRHFVLLRDASDKQLRFMDGRSPAWEDAQLALSGIVDLCKAKGIELVVFLWTDGKSSRSAMRFVHLYSGFLKDRGIPVHTFSTEIFSARHANSFIDPHPNCAGHVMVAEEVFAGLNPLIEQRRGQSAGWADR